MTDESTLPVTGYLHRQLAAFESGLIPRGVYADCEVAHDDWCDLYAGKSTRCTCHPDITLRYRGKDGAEHTVVVP